MFRIFKSFRPFKFLAFVRNKIRKAEYCDNNVKIIIFITMYIMFLKNCLKIAFNLCTIKKQISMNHVLKDGKV